MLNIKRRPNEKQTFPEREHSPLPDLFLSRRGHPFPYYSHLTSSPKSPILKSCVYAYGQGWYNMRSGAGLSEPAGPNTLSLSLTLTLAVWRHTDVIPLFWGNTAHVHGPFSRASKMSHGRQKISPVNMGREHGCQKLTPVFTGRGHEGRVG